MHMIELNWWAILLSGLSVFAVGGLWYSPILFGSTWMKETSLSDSDLSSSNPAVTYGLALIFTLIGSVTLAYVLHPIESVSVGLAMGFFVGSGLVAGSFGINYLFEKKSSKLLAINGGYHVVQYMIVGAILGLWS